MPAFAADDDAVATIEPVTDEVIEFRPDERLTELERRVAAHGVPIVDIDHPLRTALMRIRDDVARKEWQLIVSGHSGEPVSVPLDQFIEEAKAAPGWLVEDAIPAGAVTIVTGPPRSFKSTSMYQLMSAVASGADEWLGMPVRMRGPVLYIAEEGPKHFMGTALARLRIRYPASSEIRIYHMQGIKPADPTSWQHVESIIETLQPVLVVIDTYAKTLTGDENDAGAAASYLNALTGTINRQAVTFAVVHHPPKGNRAADPSSWVRGSSAFYAGADSLLCFSVDEQNGVTLRSGRIAIETKVSAPKDVCFQVTAEMELIPVGRARMTDGNLVAFVSDHWNTTGMGAPTRLIAAHFGEAKRTVQEHMKRLLDANAVVRVGQARNAKYAPVPTSLPETPINGSSRVVRPTAIAA